MAITFVHGMCFNTFSNHMIFKISFQEQAKETYVKRAPNGTCRPQALSSQANEKENAAAAEKENDAASDNLLRLNIYFGSKSVTTVTEVATYSGVSRSILRF